MQPLGRRKKRMPRGKHKVKEFGRHIEAWWEDIASANKVRDRQQAKRQINSEVK